MNILIVGSTGFVGQNFIETIEKKSIYRISSLDRKITSSNHQQLIWNNLEIIDFQQFDFIFYFTGKAHDIKKVGNDNDYFDINVGLLKKFITALQKENFQGKLIFLSSVKAIADKVNGILSEEDTPNPETAYGKSKLEAEKLLQNSLLKDKCFILRPCMIHGPGNKGNLNQLYSFVNKGIPNILASFENERSMLSIDNLVFIFEKIIEGKITPDIYQISDDGTISTNQLFQVIGNQLNKKVIAIRVPVFIVNILSKIGDYFPLPINSDRLQKLTENYVVSNQKIKKELAQNFPVSLEQGMIKTIQSFKNI